MLRLLPPRKAPHMPASAPNDLSDNLPFSDTSLRSPLALVPRPTAQIATLPDLVEKARSYVDQAKAPSTRRAYRGDWERFATWCAARHLAALPAAPETVVLYITDQADTYKVATIERRLIAISAIHQAARHESPAHSIAVREVMKGIRRELGTAQAGKAPAIAGEVKAMVADLPKTCHGIQERALLLVGFAGAFRRSELVALNADDVQLGRAGLTIHIRRSKTDQEGQGRQIGIPYGSHPETCPVRAVKAWMKAGGIVAGPLFRSINRADAVSAHRLSDKAVARAVKRGAERAGLDPSRYAGHSLRAGLATSAAAAGVEERVIAKQTGHKSMAVLRKYIRDGDLFRQNAAGAVGL